MLFFKILNFAPGQRGNAVSWEYRVTYNEVTDGLSLLPARPAPPPTPEQCPLFEYSWDFRFSEAYMNHILGCFKLCLLEVLLLLLLFGGWQSWYTGSLDSQLFFQEVEDLQEGLFLELAAQGISPVTAWVLQVGTPDYFSCCSSFVPGVWEDGHQQMHTRHQLYMASPSLEDAAGKLLQVLKCFSVYDYAKQRAVTSVLSFTIVVVQSCPTLCHPMDCRPPGSSVHGISQAEILECVALSFSRGSAPPRDRTLVSGHQGSPSLPYHWKI